MYDDYVTGDEFIPPLKSTQWIAVEDRLPEAFVDVLIYASNIIGDTYECGERYCAIDKFCIWKDGYESCFRTDRFFGKVTHWMPLPSPPEIYNEKLKS